MNFNFLYRQVHKYRSKIVIYLQGLVFGERQVHYSGSQVMIHIHELEVFGQTSSQEWIIEFDPHSWTWIFYIDKFTSIDHKLWILIHNCELEVLQISIS